MIKQYVLRILVVEHVLLVHHMSAVSGDGATGFAISLLAAES
jgi:hypothetical protein